ncbi:hypothetical protein NECAME_07836 [Necator americanus]|uniref:Uncharacterized protein n=1 Tax=Necator americanus TaxID=51031 RepID=W2TKU4_NECAM|nr:hypothetical protein NECAME_07836 [Necator americanus]ETN82725.1 hypothetical protein NECAME_07836 [Necator americanus]
MQQETLAVTTTAYESKCRSQKRGSRKMKEKSERKLNELIAVFRDVAFMRSIPSASLLLSLSRSNISAVIYRIKANRQSC